MTPRTRLSRGDVTISAAALISLAQLVALFVDRGDHRAHRDAEVDQHRLGQVAASFRASRAPRRSRRRGRAAAACAVSRARAMIGQIRAPSRAPAGSAIRSAPDRPSSGSSASAWPRLQPVDQFGPRRHRRRSPDSRRRAPRSPRRYRPRPRHRAGRGPRACRHTIRPTRPKPITTVPGPSARDLGLGQPRRRASLDPRAPRLPSMASSGVIVRPIAVTVCQKLARAGVDQLRLRPRRRARSAWFPTGCPSARRFRPRPAPRIPADASRAKVTTALITTPRAMAEQIAAPIARRSRADRRSSRP